MCGQIVRKTYKRIQKEIEKNGGNIFIYMSHNLCCYLVSDLLLSHYADNQEKREVLFFFLYLYIIKTQYKVNRTETENVGKNKNKNQKQHNP